MGRHIAVLSDIDPSGGGSHQWALNILHALNDYRTQRGCVDVSVFYYGDYPSQHPLKSLFPSFMYYPLNGSQRLLSRALRRAAVLFPRALPLLRPLLPLNRRAAQLSADLVLFPVTSLEAALCNQAYIFCLADIAHLYYPHFPEVCEGNQLRLREVTFRHGIGRAHRIMVESRELSREIGKHYGADQRKVHVVYQVLPRALEAFSPIESPSALPRPYLFYPAQLWAHKNHIRLLEAFAMLAPEFPSLRLVLSGSRKPGDDAIFAKARELGIAERVSYLGYVSDRQMPGLYRNAAAMVMPTYFGPTNIPTLEAFAFDCPAVISALPGVEEQVRDAALLFSPDDAADMARTIGRLLRGSELAKCLVEAGRRRLEVLNYTNFREAMFHLFDDALGGIDKRESR